ncbi:MAG: ribose-5-phosphate isomerase RpiA [Bacteroidetes bacterium]|nr:ribose-5-phosphate isomerase RpiA [Bacteroidota bacterium]
MDRDQAKMQVGQAAARYVEDGMVIGLGTGSTATHAIVAIGKRIQEQGLRIRGVPTSKSAEFEARRNGIPLCTLHDVDGLLDLSIDGADEVSPELDLIKGRGAAHTLEKLIASQSDRFIIVVDESKMVDQLGKTVPVPVEVIPEAAHVRMRDFQSMGYKAELRLGLRKDGPVVTDHGLWIIDVECGAISNLNWLNNTLHQLPGILDHGLFLGYATEVLIGTESGVEIRNLT